MRALAAILSAALIAAPAAAAKPGHGTGDADAPERTALVCGSSGCARVPGADALPLGGPIGRDAPAPAPYFTLAFERETLAGELEAYTILYVPSADAVAANEVRPGELTWFPVFGPGRDAAARAVRGLEPLPAPAAWPAEVKSPARLDAGGRQAATPPPGERLAAASGAASVVALWALGLLAAGRISSRRERL